MEMVSFKVENGESEKITQDAYAHRMNKSEYLRFLIENLNLIQLQKGTMS